MSQLTLTPTRNILCASPDLQDTVSWWRAWGPLNALRETTPGLELLAFDLGRTNTPPPWHTVEQSSLVFCNRPWQPSHAQFVNFVKLCGRQVWLDYDDCIWELPWWNPAAEFYGAAQLGSAKDSICRAQAVTVSTPTLANYIQERVAPDASISVVPNALPDWYDWNSLERRKLVVYRGGRTHNEDLQSVADDLAAVAAEHPDWTFAFCGALSNHGRVSKRIDPKQVMTFGMRALPEFHAWLKSSAAAILIVPLADCLFNRCKSNIAWQEGTYAGAAVLAPDFEEFRVPGCWRYQPGGFGNQLRAMIAEPVIRAADVKASREWIDANRRLSIVNVARREIVASLLPG